ncbi:MAG: hypothetical protein PF436_09895 [Prolixibacteraceae bacterium]|nr:hypothetical protein [Prolixibacteraceae bacterium]
MNRGIIFLIVLMVAACNLSKQTGNQQPMASEPFLIYKTKADYSNNVPVIMNAEKTKIVSYPSPSDIMVDDELVKPIKLIDGCLLDKRGIGVNVAFTFFTYEEYVKLDVAPDINKLMSSIIDNDPLIELYNCKKHLKIKHSIDKVNALIADGFEGCEKIK